MTCSFDELSRVLVLPRLILFHFQRSHIHPDFGSPSSILSQITTLSSTTNKASIAKKGRLSLYLSGSFSIGVDFLLPASFATSSGSRRRQKNKMSRAQCSNAGRRYPYPVGTCQCGLAANVIVSGRLGIHGHEALTLTGPEFNASNMEPVQVVQRATGQFA